jgi:zeaxanthin glucosyltransferase
MRLGFLPPFSPGHLFPTLALAKELQRRGHSVVFFVDPAMEAEVAAMGVEVCAFSRAAMPAGRTSQRHRTLAGLTGTEATCFTLRMFADFSRDMIADGERILLESRVDALVLDALWHNLDIVATHLGIPYVHINCALHADFTGVTPFFSYDWPYEPGPQARRINILGLRKLHRYFVPMRECLQEYAVKVNLPINLDSPYALHSRLAQLTQTPRAFDFPGDHWPTHFHYTGPWHDLTSRPPIPFPWERITGAPLIYASMGTLMNGSHEVFQALLAAVEAPGRQLVVSIGDHLTPSTLEPRCASTIVVNRAPQIDLLRRASLCITHAGLNTVLESLSHGVPMVCIPVALDQPGVAARVARSETGVFIRVEDLTTERLRTVVATVLQSSTHQMHAQRFKTLIGQVCGATLAGDIIEQALSRNLDSREEQQSSCFNAVKGQARRPQEALC